MGVFAALSAVAFVAAWVGPTGAALAEVAPDTVTVSAFTVAEGEAQEFEVEVAADEVPLAFERESYSVYVKPKPTPTPVPAASSSGGGGGSAPRPHYTGGGSPAEWMAAAGIAEGDWGFVDFIVRRESGWNPNATNRSSGACGLVQVYPCGKLANAYDPVVNLQWANGYANGRYGSWAGAYDFWTRNHWW